MFLADKHQRIISDFAMLEDPQERLTAVVDRTKKLPPLPVGDRNDANRVHGCVSVVWIVSELRDGRCYFRSDAESPIVRGLVAFLCDFFTGASAAEIVATVIDPLTTLDLTRNLSPTRRNGLAAAHRVIREFAQKHAAPSEPGGSPA